MGGNETFASLAGLSISFSLSVTQSLNWAVRMASDFEANMVAVERIEQYSKLPNEAARKCEKDTSLSPSWPSSGEIDFVEVKLRYRPGLPLVLKGLDIHIPARSKVGVVGRTGAGKSTIMAALLRIVELDSGRVFIDGVDIRNVGLAKLRSKIAVIPQDPVLFSVSRLFDPSVAIVIQNKKFLSTATCSLPHVFHRALFERISIRLKNIRTLDCTMYSIELVCIQQQLDRHPTRACSLLHRILFSLSTTLCRKVEATIPSDNDNCW